MASDTHIALPSEAELGASTSRLMFPPLHHADDPRFRDPILQHPLIQSSSAPVPALEDECTWESR